MNLTRIIFKKGDYVKTKGLTDEQYTAICKRLIECGAIPFNIDGHWEVTWKYYNYVGWDIYGDLFHSDNSGCYSHLLPKEDIFPDSEIVAYQYRYKENNKFCVDYGKYTKWKNCSEEKSKEIISYIEDGKTYEVRVLVVDHTISFKKEN